MRYAELHTYTNFSFLKSASHPQELVTRAYELGYNAIAITDECSLAGIVKAYVTAKELGMKIIVGSTFTLSNGCKIAVLVPNKAAYSELSGFISLARRRAAKGEYEAHLEDLRFRLQHCLIIWLAESTWINSDGGTEQKLQLAEIQAKQFYNAFKQRLWLGVSHQLRGGEQAHFQYWQQIASQYHIPMVACGSVVMHEQSRKALHDTLMAIDKNCSVAELGTQLHSNAEAYLKNIYKIYQLYPESLLEETIHIAEQCQFSLDEIRYQYPEELVPKGFSPIQYLKQLVKQGAKQRWPGGIPKPAQALLHKELDLIEELHYEYYFLTVYDIVDFARKQNILCQGRGSAANSVVCYCLHITEIEPGQINVLFERFISKERDEPPDIDVDFEHERREEVIQYIYRKYTRQRAALAATVVTYRSRSAIRDIGKALGLDPELIDQLAKSLSWWDRNKELNTRIKEAGLEENAHTMQCFFHLVEQILGFPRHLSQHVGGFIITQDKVSDIVPVENASMPDRTVIQWDKEDIEAMGLLKVDVLALGMLTALRKSLSYVSRYNPNICQIADIPKEDPATYAMLSAGDSVGVFQVESRAQMSMLPRLKPNCFYDLVIEIAIVRPGPIQGDMVHPYLRRRDGIEPVVYQNDQIKSALSSTLGVPIFQEQAIRLAMVAAGFSGGEADQLRRAMASWGKNGNLLRFEEKFIHGMLRNGYDMDFAHRLFEQIKGFGGYGFPESHSASFALLCYSSSWLKCHHPAAFYCALLNSQPMGFYSPSQLIQDARRHQIVVYPVDINCSDFDNTIELTPDARQHKMDSRHAKAWGIRLGFCRIKSLNTEQAKRIATVRGKRPFTSLDELAHRVGLNNTDLQHLAAADALRSISGHRFNAHWQASAIETPNRLLANHHNAQQDTLTTDAPTLASDIAQDMQSTGLSLRPHPMALLREEYPFKRCKKQSELCAVGHGRFVQVAGLVTGRQRPGTANGTVFLTLEDETGNINVIVWKSTQKLFRQALLTGSLLIVKGRLETQGSVVHVIAGRLLDYSEKLEGFAVKSRDFH
ncbi:Error-prone DNA polymerase [Thalassocella blandensis]|nr:Error-prone DNA polymerase [Thalassocella blandensis]